MNILGIDTTTNFCEVSLTTDTSTDFISLNEGLTHSDKLIQTINSLLKKNNLDMKNVEKISVNIGPGSFTGIRIGVSTARALAQSLKIKIIPITHIDALNFFAMSQKKFDDFYICPMIDAMRSEFFCSIYFKNQRLEDYEILNEFDLEKKFKKYSGKFLLLGNGVSKITRLSCLENIEILQNNEKEYLKTTIAEYGKKFIQSEKNYYEVAPFYIRKSQAEINKK